MTDHGAFLHPRPQFVREGWTSLNGIWRFQYDDEDAGLNAGWTACVPEGRTIRVPFAPESPMSGIGDER
ncbi:MAG: glycoside hydrolase family 2, partial [Lachnospiraceae bacterium]|nr:glycoside hydrolase family 2 [Lachnospiraceae bacterium]